MALDTKRLPHDLTQSASASDNAPTLLDLNDPQFHETSQALFADLRDTCPVAHVTFRNDLHDDQDDDARRGPFQRDAYLITRYEDASAALLDERISVDPQRAMTEEQLAQMPETPEEFQVFRRNLLGIDPPDHTRLRKLVQPSFTNRQMEAMRPRIQAIADDLLDRAEQAAAAERGETAPDRRMELISAFAFPLPIQVICEMLGVPAEDQAEVRRLFLALPIGGGRAITEDESRATLRQLSDYLVSLFARRRRAPTDDLISELVHAEEDGDTLDEQELLAMVFILLTAGHVTTVNLIASGTFALLTHPEQLARMKAEPGLARNAVEEILRYWGPLDTTLPRFAKEDITVDGVTIPRGETVLVGLDSANHDPSRFSHPDRFDISRDDANRHIAFGKGVHVCLGAPLARLEGQIALTTLFARLPALRLAVPATEIGWRPGFLRALRELPLRF